MLKFDNRGSACHGRWMAWRTRRDMCTSRGRPSSAIAAATSSLVKSCVVAPATARTTAVLAGTSRQAARLAVVDVRGGYREAVDVAVQAGHADGRLARAGALQGLQIVRVWVRRCEHGGGLPRPVAKKSCNDTLERAVHRAYEATNCQCHIVAGKTSDSHWRYGSGAHLVREVDAVLVVTPWHPQRLHVRLDVPHAFVAERQGHSPPCCSLSVLVTLRPGVRPCWLPTLLSAHLQQPVLDRCWRMDAEPLVQAPHCPSERAAAAAAAAAELPSLPVGLWTAGASPQLQLGSHMIP
jgi:hypothetical protein